MRYSKSILPWLLRRIPLRAVLVSTMLGVVADVGTTGCVSSLMCGEDCSPPPGGCKIFEAENCPTNVGCFVTGDCIDAPRDSDASSADGGQPGVVCDAAKTQADCQSLAVCMWRPIACAGSDRVCFDFDEATCRQNFPCRWVRACG
jgi:hypothetical protein